VTAATQPTARVLYKLMPMLALVMWSATTPVVATDACPARPATEADTGASTGEWKSVADRDSVCVYTRNVRRSRIREVMAVATVAAAPEEVFAVIYDFAHYPEFMPYVATTEVLKTEGSVNWVFQQHAFPFSVSDRYYTIRVDADATLAARSIYSIVWKLAATDEPSRRGRGVATSINDGFWDLRPDVDPKATHVTYFVHTDPGGAIPAFVANTANSDSAPLIIKSVRARVAAVKPRAADTVP
jgi:coenzyme Q-binding protein COQ10